jgi:hypothetical protein
MDTPEEDAAKGRAIGGNARAEKLSPERKTEIARKAAVTRWQAPRTINPSDNKVLIPTGKLNPRTDGQGSLDLQIDKQIEIDGIGMGVLSDGTAFLNGRGLARLCGIDSSRISELSADWGASTLHLTSKVKEILNGRGIILDFPHIEIKQRSGTINAYPDFLCLAVLEYYAFDAPNIRDDAKKNYRLLAGKALHDFIYTQVGYDPNNHVPEVWRQFHDRISLTYNSVPAGYFSVFKEISDVIVTLGQAGLHIDSSFVPDGSVGIHWSKHWDQNGFDNKYGARVKWDHNYPDYFPQAKSNPQPAWCYPEMALGEFRRWMRENYIGEGKFITYINGKIKQKELPASFSQLVISAYNLNDSGNA